MKNILPALGVIIITMTISLSGCRKENNNNNDSSLINNEKTNTKNALVLSQTYNNALKMYYDTARIRKNNVYCIKYDKLFHKNDSVFKVQYNMFGDKMYKNGIMMNGYTRGGMMNGTILNSGMMDSQTLQGDSAMMNGYYKSMQLLRTNHQQYHNGIYN